jgi:hypothetical protein
MVDRASVSGNQHPQPHSGQLFARLSNLPADASALRRWRQQPSKSVSSSGDATAQPAGEAQHGGSECGSGRACTSFARCIGLLRSALLVMLPDVMPRRRASLRIRSSSLVLQHPTSHILKEALLYISCPDLRPI